MELYRKYNTGLRDNGVLKLYKHYNMQLKAELLVVILTIYILNKLFYTIPPYLQHYSMDTSFLIRTIILNIEISFLRWQVQWKVIIFLKK
jgi:hypothetical protein